MLDMHHIITDGISQDIWETELITLYHDRNLPPLTLQYKDYSEWQNSDEQKQALEQQEMYWLKSYQGEIPVLDLPIDYERPSMQSFEGSDINFVINNEQAAKLKTLALEQDATLYMLLLALYYVLLAKISGQEDIVVGTPVSGRNHDDLQSIIGMFVNTLILRNYPSAEKTFTHFLEEVKQMTLQAFDNQDYPFEELVEKLGVRRDTGRNPICDVMFAFQTQEEQGLNLYESMEVKIEPYEYENRTSKFDMVLYAVEEEHLLHCNIEYSTKLFKKETIERFSAYFKDTVTAVLQDSNVKLKDIEISLELTDSKSTISHEAQGAFGF
jgi:non-ribosomal peptide synthetase component F